VERVLERRKSLKSNKNTPLKSKDPAQSALADQFQINVNIGGEKKVIVATINSDPLKTAKQFMKQHDIEHKYLETLTDLIKD